MYNPLLSHNYLQAMVHLPGVFTTKTTIQHFASLQTNTKASDVQQKQEADRNMAVRPNAHLQPTVWKCFTRANID